MRNLKHITRTVLQSLVMILVHNFGHFLLLFLHTSFWYFFFVLLVLFSYLISFIQQWF